jgi:uncharacterized membrane protein HdeD (DUF308 family)
MIALQGVLALLFGILALILPGAALIAFVALFAAWALIGGGSAVLASIRSRHTDRGWWMWLLFGIVSFIAGIVAILNPGITLLVLVLIMGVNALINGVLEIVMAIRLRKTIEREWLLALAGAVSVIFGVLVLAFPLGGALAMVWLVSFYAIAHGVLLLTLAFRARKWKATGGAARDLSGHPRTAAS